MPIPWKTITAIGATGIIRGIDIMKEAAKNISRDLSDVADFFERRANMSNQAIYTCAACGYNFIPKEQGDIEWCPECGSCDTTELAGFTLLEPEDNLEDYENIFNLPDSD